MLVLAAIVVGISCKYYTSSCVCVLQLIHNISRDFHDKIIKCEVHNAVGKSEESKTLDISCKY